jgi:hypothetical protein
VLKELAETVILLLEAVRVLVKSLERAFICREIVVRSL